jgi:hypothetical protein
MAFYDQVHAVQKFRLGTRVKDQSGNEYIYLEGVASTAIGSWVNFDGGVDFSTALLDTDVAATQLGRIAVAKAAVGADQFGWYCIYGATNALSLTAATDAKNCFATSTGGSVDDSGAGAEVLVFNAFYTGAVNETTLLAAVVLNYPFMTGLTLD